MPRANVRAAASAPPLPSVGTRPMNRLVVARLLASLALATLVGTFAACSSSAPGPTAAAPSRDAETSSQGAEVSAPGETSTSSETGEAPTSGGEFAPDAGASPAAPETSDSPVSSKPELTVNEFPARELPPLAEPSESTRLEAPTPPPPPPPRRYASAAPPTESAPPAELPTRENPRESIAADDSPRGSGASALPRIARGNPLRASRLRAADSPDSPAPPPLPARSTVPPPPRFAPVEPREPTLDMERKATSPSAAPDAALDEPPSSSATAMAAPPELPTGEAPTSSIPDALAAPAAPLDRNVRVFYGTDRRALDEPQSALDLAIGWIPGTLAGSFAVLCGAAAYVWPARRRWLAIAATSATALAGFLLLRGPLTTAVPPLAPSDVGVEYGAERGRLTVGYCEVSIPPRHDPGEVESPSILRLEVRPDVERHVVLRRVERTERDEFLAAVREQVAQSPRRDLFLFVHGYNVSFEDAARRTAQMAFDLRFQGAPIFFSWPSQAQLIKYTVDENNVAWSVPHLKEFLLDIVRHTDAKSVNLIAHSMGNRALLTAIRELEYELRQEQTLFNEVVLAAPDIDADIFRRDIAPALRRAANHSTLYASANDQALVVSKIVHGYPRAGDTGEGLVLVEGIETIDVSRVDLSLLGHSYYGSSELVLDDLAQLLNESRRASQRPLLRQADRQGTPYWIFREVQNARRSLPLPR